MADQENDYEEFVPISAKLGYGGSSIGHLFMSGIALGSIDIFYLKATNILPEVMALSWILFIVWNMINDPLIGIIQDKTKSKLGRRIPYLRFGSIFYALAFIWIWFPFATVQELLFWNHLLMLFVFDTIYSMMGLIFYAMPAEMALTPKERSNIMIFTTAFGAIGMGGAIIVPIIMLGGDPNIAEFQIAMVIAGIISGTLIFIGSYFIKENKYTQMEDSLGFFESIKESFKNKPFLIMEVSMFGNVIMQGVLLSYIVFIFDYAVDASLDLLNIISIFILVVVLGILIVWMFKNIEKYGLRKLMMLGAILATLGFLLIMIFGLSANVTATNKMPLYMMALPMVFIGLGLLCYLLLSQPLMADCMDYDEVLTGKRRETTYAGVNALITKPAVSIGHGIFLMILAAFRYDENIADPLLQPPEVATGVILAFCIVPIICMTIGFIALYFYPLDDEDWKQKKRNLQVIHKQKEKDYLEYLKKEGMIGKDSS